MRHNRQSLTAL
jgi:small nuclear ribonucleoprotein D3